METQELMGQETLPATTPTQDEKTMALLSHILTLVAWFIAPLIIYLLKKDESTFVAEHAKESLNFQITVGIGYIISFILMTLLIGVLMIAVLGVVALILIIVATIKASEGKIYRYPFNLRLIK
jgi:uncharacterized Tic20 family protein